MNSGPQTTKVCPKCGKPLASALVTTCDDCRKNLVDGRKKRGRVLDILIFMVLCLFGAYVGDAWLKERPLGFLIGICLIILIYVIRFALSM
jgi:predicted nucleic acid-binding Zn ribbon protein